MKKLRQSKTFWLNLLMVAAGAISGAMGTEAIASNPALVGYFASAVGIINIILRIFTSKSIAK